MPVLNVAVIGGSIAGCAAAIALRRAGCEVTVFERSRGNLEDRGAGIGMPLALLHTLVERDFVDPRDGPPASDEGPLCSPCRCRGAGAGSGAAALGATHRRRRDQLGDRVSTLAKPDLGCD